MVEACFFMVEELNFFFIIGKCGIELVQGGGGKKSRI